MKMISDESKQDSAIKWASEKEGLIKNFDDFEKFKLPSPLEISYSNFEKNHANIMIFYFSV